MEKKSKAQEWFASHPGLGRAGRDVHKLLRKRGAELTGLPRPSVSQCIVAMEREIIRLRELNQALLGERHVGLTEKGAKESLKNEKLD